MQSNRVLAGVALCAFMTFPATAAPEDFHPGTVIEDYADIASVVDERLTSESSFAVAYDVAGAGPDDAPNRSFVTPARFLNMHVDAGVPLENIKLAVVVHGGAYKDLLTEETRGAPNPNADLIARLVAKGVRFELCGQTAAHYDVTDEDLLPGVTISLSAMTSHALLQQEGYTLNPF